MDPTDRNHLTLAPDDEHPGASSHLVPPRHSQRSCPTSIQAPAAPAGSHRRSRRALLRLVLGLLWILMAPVASNPSTRDGPARPEPFANDARLDTKVSLTAWAEPLEDLLARVSRESGVQLLFEGRDVGDQRVNIVVRDQPLRRLQRLLAKDLNLYWRRERKRSTYRYVLFQDVRSRKEEQELLSRARDRFEEGVRRLVASLKLTPDQVETLRGQSAGWARRLTDPARRQAVELLSRLGPSRWDRLMETGRVEMPFESLSRADQERVRRYVEVSNEQRDREDEARGTPGENHIGDVAVPGAKVAIRVFGGVPAGPDSTLDFVIYPAHGNIGGHGLGLGFTDDEQGALREAFAPPGFEQEKRNPPADGGPRVTVTWKEKPRRWEEVLQAVVVGAKIQVVSDAYLYQWWEENMDLPEASTLRDRPLGEVLDKISAPFFYAWRRDGDVYLFRDRNWFLEKQHNVPERDLRRWRGHLQALGRLELEDLVDLALLTWRQLRMVGEAGIPREVISGHGAVLRLYAALNPLQRSRLETTGVPVGELNARQAELLHTWKQAAGDSEWMRMRREPGKVIFLLGANSTVTEEEHVPLGRPGSGIHN
jgi:hypothetical protein